MVTAYSPVLGCQRPRIESLPGAITSIKNEALIRKAIDLARFAGLELDDWQEYVLSESMRFKKGDIWAAFEVALIVARQNGKNAILEARELAGLFLIETDRLIIHTAHEFKTAVEAYRRLRGLVENCPLLHSQVKHRGTQWTGYHDAAGEQGIELTNGKRIKFIARSRSSGRGFTADLLVWDEAMILDAGMVGSTLPTLSARPNPQVWYTASAGLRKSTQLAKVRKRGIKGTSKTLLFMEWSINPHTEYCEPDCDEHDDPLSLYSVAKANPALGIRISADYVEREREAMSGNDGEFDRERLSVGEYPAEEDDWAIIREEWWDNTELDVEGELSIRQPVFSIEVNPDRTTAAIAESGLLDDGSIVMHVIECRGGTRWVVDTAKELAEGHRNTIWIVDPHAGAGSLIDGLKDEGLRVEKVQASDAAQAFGKVFDALRDGEVSHIEDKDLKRAVAGADIRKLSNAYAWDRVNSAVDITSLMACTFAFWGFIKYKKASTMGINRTVHFNVDEVLRLLNAGIYTVVDVNRIHSRGLFSAEDIEKLREHGIEVGEQ